MTPQLAWYTTVAMGRTLLKRATHATYLRRKTPHFKAVVGETLEEAGRQNHGRGPQAATPATLIATRLAIRAAAPTAHRPRHHLETEMDTPLIKFNVTVTEPLVEGEEPNITVFTDFFEDSMAAVEETMGAFPLGSKIDVTKAT